MDKTQTYFIVILIVIVISKKIPVIFRHSVGQGIPLSETCSVYIY